jgi:hypothetical protein
MHKLELSHTELNTLKDVLISDMQFSEFNTLDFSNEQDMFFYYERAKILNMLREIGETT